MADFSPLLGGSNKNIAKEDASHLCWIFYYPIKLFLLVDVLASICSIIIVFSGEQRIYMMISVGFQSFATLTLLSFLCSSAEEIEAGAVIGNCLFSVISAILAFAEIYKSTYYPYAIGVIAEDFISIALMMFFVTGVNFKWLKGCLSVIGFVSPSVSLIKDVGGLTITNSVLCFLTGSNQFSLIFDFEQKYNDEDRKKINRLSLLLNIVGLAITGYTCYDDQGISDIINVVYHILSIFITFCI